MSVIDFPGKPKPPEDILRDVIEHGVAEFAMAAVSKDGNLFFATSSTDKAEILLLLELFRHQIVSGQLDE